MARDYQHEAELRKARGGKTIGVGLKNQEEVEALEKILKENYCDSLGQLVRKLIYGELEIH